MVPPRTNPAAYYTHTRTHVHSGVGVVNNEAECLQALSEP